jgi:hypothetical protein
LRRYDQWRSNLSPPLEFKKEEKVNGNARLVHLGVKCFECAVYGNKSYKFLKMKN